MQIPCHIVTISTTKKNPFQYEVIIITQYVHCKIWDMEYTYMHRPDRQTNIEKIIQFNRNVRSLSECLTANDPS